ncbi:hypothetical protein C8P68_11229 [Mucilaginibacter yixingensis]|uniref:Uncharacterized protein n=1 Tax=Mucilaginibacter yixingensis TaxID=1295612 RepID=A0A2T5J4Q9_9SPHI|nr:hypothetical protein C8P68_11229 [Mucilaginibacter yixingensis]
MCSMTSLPTNQYIDLLNSYYALFRDHKISESLLNRGLFNEFDTQYKVAKLYNDPSLRKLLKKMLNDDSLSKAFRMDIRNEILNGRWLHDLQRTGHLK